MSHMFVFLDVLIANNCHLFLIWCHMSVFDTKAWRMLLVYMAKNHTLFGSFEIITNQIKEIFAKELKLKNFFPLNSFGPGYKLQ